LAGPRVADGEQVAGAVVGVGGGRRDRCARRLGHLGLAVGAVVTVVNRGGRRAIAAGDVDDVADAVVRRPGQGDLVASVVRLHRRVLAAEPGDAAQGVVLLDGLDAVPVELADLVLVVIVDVLQARFGVAYWRTLELLDQRQAVVGVVGVAVGV